MDRRSSRSTREATVLNAHRKRSQRHDSSEALGNVFRAILGAIGPALLNQGITPSKLADIAKAAFVHAAALDAKLANGRVNASRIAALTGMTRVDVRRHLAEPKRARDSSQYRDRVTRVVEGWINDHRFQTARGRPRALRLGANNIGFGLLVRSHSGDIPPRVVLDELARRKMVAHNGQWIRLLPTGRRIRASTKALPALIPHVATLIRSAAAPSSKMPYSEIVELHVETTTHEAVFVREAIRALAATMAAIRAASPQSTKTVAPTRSIRIAAAITSAPIDFP